MCTSCRFFTVVVFFMLGIASCTTDHHQKYDLESFTWKIPFDGSDSEPVMYHGTVYIGSMDGAIYAIHSENGKQIWKFQTGVDLPRDNIIRTSGKSFGDMVGAALDGSPKRDKGKREIDATPAIENGTVYIGSGDYNVYALDGTTGTLKWATGVDGPVYDKVLFTKKNLIVHSAEGRDRSLAYFPGMIYALDKKNGQILWSTKGQGSAGSPALVGDTIYYTSYEGYGRASYFLLNTVDVETGKLLRSLKLQGKRPGNIYATSELVYVTAYQGGGMIHLPNNTVGFAPVHALVYAVNTSDGQVAWKRKAGTLDTAISPEIAIGSHNIYYVTENGVHAVDKKTGVQRWFVAGEFYHHQLVAGKLLYVHGDSMRKNNQLYAIDPETGKVIWRYQDKNLFYTKVVADTVYVSAQLGQIALHAYTGKVRWRFKIRDDHQSSGGVTSVPLIFGSYAIFPTYTDRGLTQGYLYCIDSDMAEDVH